MVYFTVSLCAGYCFHLLIGGFINNVDFSPAIYSLVVVAVFFLQKNTGGMQPMRVYPITPSLLGGEGLNATE